MFSLVIPDTDLRHRLINESPFLEIRVCFYRNIYPAVYSRLRDDAVTVTRSEPQSPVSQSRPVTSSGVRTQRHDASPGPELETDPGPRIELELLTLVTHLHSSSVVFLLSHSEVLPTLHHISVVTIIIGQVGLVCNCDFSGTENDTAKCINISY